MDNKLIYKDKVTNEWYFDDRLYILSETDEKGIIIYANEVFCTIAKYKEEELLGQPHNIVRHPDMPRTAFKMVWDDIQTKGFWEGYVKNKRSDGGFYWVFSTIIRKTDASGKITYLSIRNKPNREQVKKAEALYATLD